MCVDPMQAHWTNKNKSHSTSWPTRVSSSNEIEPHEIRYSRQEWWSVCGQMLVCSLSMSLDPSTDCRAYTIHQQPAWLHNSRGTTALHKHRAQDKRVSSMDKVCQSCDHCRGHNWPPARELRFGGRALSLSCSQTIKCSNRGSSSARRELNPSKWLHSSRCILSTSYAQPAQQNVQVKVCSAQRTLAQLANADAFIRRERNGLGRRRLRRVRGHWIQAFKIETSKRFSSQLKQNIVSVWTEQNVDGHFGDSQWSTKLDRSVNTIHSFIHPLQASRCASSNLMCQNLASC